jgi:hypothetical protein
VSCGRAREDIDDINARLASCGGACEDVDDINARQVQKDKGPNLPELGDIGEEVSCRLEPPAACKARSFPQKKQETD